MLTLLLGNNIRIIDEVIERESRTHTETVTQLLDSVLAVNLFERDFATSERGIAEDCGYCRWRFNLYPGIR